VYPNRGALFLICTSNGTI